MEESDIFHYDIGYYEGIRNILQIIQYNLSHRDLSEQERIDLLLKDVVRELDNAIESQKRSERRFYDGY